MRLFCATFVAFLLGALCSCSRHSESPDRSAKRLLADPEFFAVDAGGPSNRFDGRGGSLLLGDGWGAPERSPPSQGRPGFPFVWALDTEAVLFVPGSFSGPMDFYGRGCPVGFLGAPPQRIDFTLDGMPAGHVDVADGWQDVRGELTRGLVPGRLHRLVLKFARSKSPLQLNESRDRRILCMMFSEVAVIPRGVLNAHAFTRASRYDPETETLTLPEGGAAAIALPSAAAMAVHLGAVAGRCPGCIVSVDVVANGISRNIFQIAVSRASGVRATFDAPGPREGRVILSVRDHFTADASRRVRIILPNDFLVVRRRETRPPSDRPDLFVYLIDTLRADELGPYGSGRFETPETTRFARDAVVYEDTWAASTWTLPSAISILSGVYPVRHGVMQGYYRYVDDRAPSLARVLGRAGYDTAGISQSLVVTHRFGADEGFSDFFFEDRLGPVLYSQDVRAYMIGWLTRGGRQRSPSFTYIHTVDPHSPYTPPPGPYSRPAQRSPGHLAPDKYDPQYFLANRLAGRNEEVAHLRALYDGEVLYADEQFGRFLDVLKWMGKYDESAIVLVADHGEEFGEHGGFEHGRTVYEELLRVPLIVKYPNGRWAGRRVAERVSTVDIYPTFLDLASVGAPASGLDGASLLFPLIGRGEKDRVIFSEVNPVAEATSAEVAYRAVGIGGVKGIETATGIDQFCRPLPTWRVFDLRSDVREQSPLRADDERADACWKRLNTFLLREKRQRSYGDSERRGVDEEYVAKLRALGYLN